MADEVKQYAADESFRGFDMASETQVAEFMDTYFYQKMEKRHKDKISFTRIKDKDRQLQGIDVVVKTKDGTYNVDEKTAIYYSNAMIPTFAFELESLQGEHNNVATKGWFINNELKTDYYMLIWSNVKCTKSVEDGKTIWIRKNVQQITVDDFTILEIMLIHRNVLKRAVQSDLKMDDIRLLELAKRIRAKSGNGIEKKPLFAGINVQLSGQLSEKPVNLVIQKSYLKKYAQAMFYVGEDDYARFL